MTTNAPGLRTNAAARGRALSLAAALLLAASGLFALPAELFSPAYYSDSWSVAAAAGQASVLPTLMLVAAAVTLGSRVLLLAISALTVLHLVGLVALATAAANGPASPLAFLSGQVELGLAVVCLALGWWDTSRTRSRPGIALTLVALTPVVGLFVEANQMGDEPWWIFGVGILVLEQLPAFLTVLAAGLVCLPSWGARIGAATLISLAGLSLLWADATLYPTTQVNALQLAVIGLALLCALVAARQASPAGTPAEPDDAAPDGVAPDTSLDTPPDRPRATQAVAALAVLVLTVALTVPELFAQGPGIRPAASGILLLIGYLVHAALPAALTFTAGAATLGTRGALVVASAGSGLLALALLVSRTALGRPATPHDVLPFVALGLSLGLAWAGAARPGPAGARLRWAAVVPLVLAASPLLVLTDPSTMAYAGDPMFLDRYVLRNLLPGIVPVLAAALLGYPRWGTRTAASVLICVLGVHGVVVLLEDYSGTRLQAALHLLQIAGYGLACLLVLATVLALSRRSSTSA